MGHQSKQSMLVYILQNVTACIIVLGTQPLISCGLEHSFSGMLISVVVLEQKHTHIVQLILKGIIISQCRLDLTNNSKEEYNENRMRKRQTGKGWERKTNRFSHSPPYRVWFHYLLSFLWQPFYVYQRRLL